VRPEGLGKLEKFNRLIGTRARDHPAYIIAPQPSMLPRAHLNAAVDLSNVPLCMYGYHSKISTVEPGYTAGIWGHHEHPRYKLTAL
jgi:hypothetical protein